MFQQIYEIYSLLHYQDKVLTIKWLEVFKTFQVLGSFTTKIVKAFSRENTFFYQYAGLWTPYIQPINMSHNSDLSFWSPYECLIGFYAALFVFI